MADKSYEVASAEVDAFFRELVESAQPEPSALAGPRPLTAEQRQAAIVADLNRTPTPDYLDVEASIAQDRARMTFLEPQRNEISVNAIGEPVITPMANLGGEPATSSWDPLGQTLSDGYLASTSSLSASPAPSGGDAEGRALQSLGIPVAVDEPPASVLATLAPVSASTPAPHLPDRVLPADLVASDDSLPCLQGSISDVIGRLVPELPANQRELAQELAGLAEDMKI
jgi:hypothetical protein